MDRFKELIPSDARDYIAAAVTTLGGCYVVAKLGGFVIGWVSAKRLQRRWRNTPKDMVILHKIPPGLAIPNLSPFVLKLETYLRMANIPYQIDMNDGMGPKGKTPWITLNGQHISDSQLCIEFLAKKFNKRIGNYTDEQRAIGAVTRIALDEYFYWGLLMWRYVQSSPKGHGPEKIFAMPKLLVKIMVVVFGGMVRQGAWSQGLGRHSEEEIVQLVSDTLRAVSKVLGSNKFILGDEPTEDDCAIFGELAQCLWGMPGSPYEKLLNDELHNLKQYCLRMKEAYWVDWEKCIGGGGVEETKTKNN